MFHSDKTLRDRIVNVLRSANNDLQCSTIARLIDQEDGCPVYKLALNEGDHVWENWKERVRGELCLMRREAVVSWSRPFMAYKYRLRDKEAALL